MDYFHSYRLPVDDGVVAAWDSQLTAAAEMPAVYQLIARRGAEIFPEFSKRYAEIRALPRSARRALQRKLARSSESAVPAEWRRKIAYSIAGAALLLALGQIPAEAGTIIVNTSIADVDALNPTCSLGDAIHSANTNSDYGGCTGATAPPNTIVLPKGSQVLTQSFANYGGATGLPLITTNITISGNKTKITRAKGAPAFRFLAITPPQES